MVSSLLAHSIPSLQPSYLKLFICKCIEPKLVRTVVEDSKFATPRFNINTLKLSSIRYRYVRSLAVSKELLSFTYSKVPKYAVKRELFSYITCSTCQGPHVKIQIVVLGRNIWTVDPEVSLSYILIPSFHVHLQITVEPQVLNTKQLQWNIQLSRQLCISIGCNLVHHSATAKYFLPGLIYKRYFTVTEPPSSHVILIRRDWALCDTVDFGNQDNTELYLEYAPKSQIYEQRCGPHV